MAIPIHEVPTTYFEPTLADRHLAIVPDIIDERPEGEASREAFDYAFQTRETAAAVEKKIDDEELATVQEDVRGWLEESGLLELPDDTEGRRSYYTQPSEELAAAKILGLTEYLVTHHPDKISAEELVATRAFFDSAFAMYNDKPGEGRETMADADGSFAFVVPARMARNHPEYGKEVEPLIPALRYVPNELRAQMLVGLPPFVIDQYAVDEHGRHGYLIFAQVTEDLVNDIGGLGAFKAAQDNVNAAIDFADRRFGVKVVGLGAILPGLTRYGRQITNKNVITTTGHGGTAVLVDKTVEAALEARPPKRFGFLRRKPRIGILGLGSIGAAMAHVTADTFPDAEISLYDIEESRIARTQKDAERRGGAMKAAKSIGSLIRRSDVIVSAVTTPVDPAKEGVTSMAGKKVVDDSQPGAFDKAQVEAMGGNLLWVIGSDQGGDTPTATRRGYDYGTLGDDKTDVFGCEAEAASLAAYYFEQVERGVPEEWARKNVEAFALRGPVTPESAQRIGRLFTWRNIVAARPQAFGQYVQL